ncbi:MAG: RusA family crossover junction endodeoxyribonuclease [Hafnia sp.]|uniref:RusA family crossover junction endodeoxyribonuclease n=1 Tax=Hafnia alvei TaxID=569 RepID=UPI0010352699|nr:RusA family crossover junction endodeoxyribonuclease [Hafnia alvei]MCE9870293.1 RusA family crossover junction endodeoxyribonuclease [Hafnia alvei]TBL95997.1 RusA family crossover junction endodeoxyribonuclease [Hafnia alvei]
MKLILPFPPSVNGYWRAPNKGASIGKHLVSERGRKYQAETYAMVIEQLRRKPKAITENVSVSVVLFPPTKARRDLDNYFKALFDALTKANVWADDSQIKELSAKWGPVVKGGRVELVIDGVTACA